MEEVQNRGQFRISDFIFKTQPRSAYISGYPLDGRTPYPIRDMFEQDMERFSKKLSKELAEEYQSAIEDECSPEEAMERTQTALEEGIGILSAKLRRCNNISKALIALHHYNDEGYNMFLFLSEQGEKTCEHCKTHRGKVYSIYDLYREGVIPPLHPNCRCELIAMDGFAVRMYNIDSRRFLQHFERLRGAGSGGIFVLDHDFFRIGLSPDALTRITYPNGTPAIDIDKPLWYADPPQNMGLPENWPMPYLAGLISEANEMVEEIISAQNERAAVMWDSAGGFLDWLTLGFVSGIWDGVVLRHNTMTDGPSVYNFLNAVFLGTLDTLRGVVKPKKPWSLEHLLDIVRTVLIAYAAFKAVKKLQGLGRAGAADDIFNLRSKNLMRELANSGEKVSIDDVVAVTRTADGRFVWLETGTESAGLRHIISRHTKDFANKGISVEDIPEFLMTALKYGRVLGKQNTRDVFEVEFHGVIQRVSISIGSNGFIFEFKGFSTESERVAFLEKTDKAIEMIRVAAGDKYIVLDEVDRVNL